MRIASILVVTFALMASSVFAQSRGVAPILVFHPDGFWLNLHQFLYVLGRHEALMPDRTRRATAGAPDDAAMGLAVLTADEQRVWREATAFYAKDLSRQDAVFDEALIRVGQTLARAGFSASVSGVGLEPDHASVLERAAPIYRKAWWSAHRRANAAWVEATHRLVDQHGAAVLAFITRAYGLPWPATGYPINVSAYANWAGAFSTRGNLLIMSSLDPGLRGLMGFETAFHEAMHQWDDTVQTGLAAEAKRQQRPVPDLLSHALIFYTAGEAMRAIAPAHVPYAEANGLWRQRGLGAFKPALDEVWKPYLSGKGTRDEAFAALVARIN
jgi:hypothetical protein